jgi:hypothetical protein
MFIYTNTTLRPEPPHHKRVCLFSMVVGYFPSPLFHHPQKRARMLIFEGGDLFSITTTPTPSKTSTYARFRGCWSVFHHHHPNTLENEHVCSFLKVVVCFPSLPSHHPRKRVRRLVFDGGCLFSMATTPTASKTRVPAHF